MNSGRGLGGSDSLILILLFAMIYGNGGFGLGGGKGGNPVTESDLCNANNFAQIENAIGRNGDQIANAYTGLQNGISSMGYEALRNNNTLAMLIGNGFGETQKSIDAIGYNIANQAAAINANTTAQTQKILDAICASKVESLQAQVNQLQMQNALCGVVRVPQYVTTQSPFAGNNCCCPNL